MSNLRVTTWRKSIADSDLPRNARLVAWALSNYMSSDCRHAFPGVERLAHDTAASEKTVRRQLTQFPSMADDASKLKKMMDGIATQVKTCKRRSR